MAEPKPTATAIAELKKREAELVQTREALKTSIVAQIGDLITQLAELGFSYSLEEQVNNGNGPKRIGRPRKEAARVEKVETR